MGGVRQAKISEAGFSLLEALQADGDWTLQLLEQLDVWAARWGAPRVLSAFAHHQFYNLENAVVLLEQLLPGCEYILGRGRVRPGEPPYGAAIFAPGSFMDGDDEAEPIGEGESEKWLARAVLIALVEAVETGGLVRQ